MASGFTVRVEFDKKRLMQSIADANREGIAEMATEALKDANYYARHDTGETIKSSIRASQPEKGILIWDTPYAKKVYYTGRPSTSMNPHASLLWAHKGYAENHRKYETILAKAAARRRV